MIRLVFSVGFQLTLYKFIGRSQLLGSFVEAPQKEFFNVKTSKPHPLFLSFSKTLTKKKQNKKKTQLFSSSVYVTSFNLSLSMHLWFQIISFPISFSSHTDSKPLISQMSVNSEDICYQDQYSMMHFFNDLLFLFAVYH